MIKNLSLFICVVLLITFVGCRTEKELSESNTSVLVENDVSIKEEFVYEGTQKIKQTDTSESTTSEDNTYGSGLNSADTNTTVLEIKPESKPTGREQSTASVTSSDTEKSESNISSVTPIKNATANDSKEIASLIAKYINDHRNRCNVESADILPGLSKYAEYRSRQLISNYSHDTNDERAAATALKYGKYIEPSLYGMTGEPYYVACSGEAIVKAGYAGSKEYIAESIANLVANSIAHWNYVGHPANKFIAVGVTYESGLWYCDIAVSDVNYDETS